jgi:hypothetical protein
MESSSCGQSQKAVMHAGGAASQDHTDMTTSWPINFADSIKCYEYVNQAVDEPYQALTSKFLPNFS